MDAIDKFCEFFTKKIPISSESEDLRQDQKHIYYGVKKEGYAYGSKLGVIHEICHYIAASPQERRKSNIGLPDNDHLNDPTLLKEIMAREFTRILFLPWAKATLSQNELAYVEYLSFDIFREPESAFHDRNTREGLSYPLFRDFEELLVSQLKTLDIEYDDARNFVNYGSPQYIMYD